MKHLTEEEILRIAQGSADYMTQATLSNHLAVCAVCRREVEFQRALLKGARNVKSPVTSRGFTRRVMNVVYPTHFGAARQWILNNLGAMVGMGGILSVVGWTLFSNVPSKPVPMLDSLDRVSVDIKPLQNSWSAFSDLLKEFLSFIPVPSGAGGILIVSVGVLLALYAVDRLLIGRVSSSRRA